MILFSYVHCTRIVRVYVRLQTHLEVFLDHVKSMHGSDKSITLALDGDWLDGIITLVLDGD